MAGKMLDGWEFARQCGGYHIHTWQNPRTKLWEYGLVSMPDKGAMARPGPWEDVGGDFESKEAAIKAAKEEIDRRSQQPKGGRKQ
jgi:hypothetical protein